MLHAPGNSSMEKRICIVASAIISATVSELVIFHLVVASRITLFA